MRFTAIIAGAGLAAASLEGGHAAGSTLYSTQYTTVTSCGPTVTNCPAKSTVVKSHVIPLTTSTVYSTSVYTVTQCPDDVKDCPKNKGHAVTKTEVVAVSTTICPVEATGTGIIKPSTNSTGHWGSWPSQSEGGNKPTGSWPPKSLTTAAPACPTFSVKTISTSITTVIPTVIYETVSIPCPTPAQPSAGWPTKPSNGTVTKPPQSTVTAGASTLGGSIILAAAAGFAAVALL